QDALLIAGLPMIEDRVGALAPDEVEALLGPRGTEHGEPHRARRLHRREPHAAAGAVDEDGLRRPRDRRVMQGVVRRAVRHPDAGALLERDPYRERMDLACHGESVFRVASGERVRGVDAVTRTDRLDALTHGLDETGSIRSRRVR